MKAKLFTFAKVGSRNNGDCPFCHKGPIVVLERDSNAVIIDIDGTPVYTTNMKYDAIGVCINCNAIVGEYTPIAGQYVLTTEAPARRIVESNILTKLNISPFAKSKGDEPYCIIEI